MRVLRKCSPAPPLQHDLRHFFHHSSLGPHLNTMVDEITKRTLAKIAHFYDQRKVGETGFLGFRRSSDLTRLAACLLSMTEQHFFLPQSSSFLGLGCADGRVNVLLSYLVKKSVGIEMDEWTLDEYLPLKKSMESALTGGQLPLPRDNIHLYHGDSMDGFLHERIRCETGVAFEDFDLFYTYLTMQEEFAELISQKAKRGSVFMVYGLEKILPRFSGLRLLTEKPLHGIVALYQKI